MLVEGEGGKVEGLGTLFFLSLFVFPTLIAGRMHLLGGQVTMKSSPDTLMVLTAALVDGQGGITPLILSKADQGQWKEEEEV